MEVGTLDEVGIHKGASESATLKIRNGKYKEVHSMLFVNDAEQRIRKILRDPEKAHPFQSVAPQHFSKITKNKCS